jgi:hypothetical protein
MKRALLLMVVPALLVALGFAQTPAASINADQTNIKGCLGGSDGNYTVVQDNTGHIFKITTSSVDLKSHVGHDVTLIGHKASAADNSFVVTELNMISEHCAAAAAAPVAAVTTPSETASTPAEAAAGPTTTTSTLAQTSVTPAAATAAPTATVTTPAETAVAPPAETTPPAESVITSAAATPPEQTVVTPAAVATAPKLTVSTPAETASAPAARHRRMSAEPAAATAAPAVAASTSSETVSPPAAATTTPAAAASTPAAAEPPPTATGKSWSSWLLIPFAVVVIILATMVPVLSRWRKRKLLERTGAQNLSFNREESSDQVKSDPKEPRKAA